MSDVINFKPNTLLLMFSGGIDSLGALYLLLTDDKYKDYNIHSHHIHLINKENRSIAESQAVGKIYEYLLDPKYKRFTYSESTIQIPYTNNKFSWDSDISNFVASQLASISLNITKVALGVTKSDDAGNHSFYSERSANLFKLYCLNKVEKLYPVRLLSKTSIMEMLPPELLDLAWYCRTPRYINQNPQVCNRCKTCKEVNRIKNGSP